MSRPTTSERQLHLNLNILNVGFYASAWRADNIDPAGFGDYRHYVNCARIAERGTFDAVFMADRPTLFETPPRRPFQSLDPLVVLSAVAAATDHIGLIGTASTTYNEPYNLARRFATLDHVSGGRAGWNMVTTSDLNAAQNFGLPQVPSHADRYRRAQEFAELVSKLWDSWEDNAMLGDKAAGRLLDPARVHAVNHQGTHFAVRGPLNMPRPPQGRPVLIQAGGSDDGRDFAARCAEVVFTLSSTLEEARAYAADLKARSQAYGRAQGSPVILPGLTTVIGGTQEEALRRQSHLVELLPIEDGLVRLASTLGVGPEELDPDGYLPDTLPLPADHNHTMFYAAVTLARKEHLTVRQLIARLGGGGGHRIVAGTPEQIANTIEEWFREGVADGFNLMPDLLPEGAETFVDQVVPILRKRGIFRTEYTGITLRDHLGLSRPVNYYTQSALEATAP